MVLDSIQYDGLCACGRTHKMETRLCVIEAGCLKQIDAYLKRNGIQGYSVAVYDEHTYRATADRHPKTDAEVILPAADLHADEHGVALLLEKLPEKAQVILAIGAGTVHDISRFCAYQRKLDFVSCPTAASVDGFCSSVAAMTWNGCKKTMTAVAPRMVVADLEIIQNAPVRLAKSGFGDMVGKFVALTDWKIAHILTGEYHCRRIAEMTLHAAREAIDALDGLLTGDTRAYEKLMYGLLLSGLAMQMIGNSRPASGAEHHISHLIEMKPRVLGASSDALHGEKVGVGTLLALREYQRMAALRQPVFFDYRPCSDGQLRDVFGELAEELAAENAVDAAASVTAEKLYENWDRIRGEIAKLPQARELAARYEAAGVKSTLPALQLPAELEKTLLTYSPLVRNRLTLMRLRGCVQ